MKIYVCFYHILKTSLRLLTAKFREERSRIILITSVTSVNKFKVPIKRKFVQLFFIPLQRLKNFYQILPKKLYCHFK